MIELMVPSDMIPDERPCSSSSPRVPQTRFWAPTPIRGPPWAAALGVADVGRLSVGWTWEPEAEGS